MVAGLSATRTPVPALILYCETWFDPLSTTKRNLPAESVAMEIGPRLAGNGEPAIDVRLPSGTDPGDTAQVADCLSQTVNALTLPEPEFPTYRKLPSGLRARADGVMPTGYGARVVVNAPELAIEKTETVPSN
jgi:hypothetical protein